MGGRGWGGGVMGYDMSMSMSMSMKQMGVEMHRAIDGGCMAT